MLKLIYVTLPCPHNCCFFFLNYFSFSLSRTIKFQSRSTTATGGGSGVGLKRVATEEIIEEIKQEEEPSSTSMTGDGRPPGAPGGNASTAAAAAAPPSTSFAVPNKVKKLDCAFSIGVRKSSLSNLVVKKKPVAATVEGEKPKEILPKPVPAAAVVVTESATSRATDSPVAASPAVVTPVSGLGLLGAYSDSDNSSGEGDE